MWMGITVIGGILFCMNISVFSSEAAQTAYTLSFKKIMVSESDTFAIPEYFTVNSFKGSSDGAFTIKEFLALTNLVPGAIMTREQFLQSLERVRQTESCNKVTFTFLGPPEAVDIFCTIECSWIIRFVKVEGVSSGKDEYARLYELVPGQSFDLEKHKQLLQVLKNFLKDQGYLASQVTDNILYDENKKWVSVTLVIKKGKRTASILSDTAQKEKNKKVSKEEKYHFLGNHFFSTSALKRKVADLQATEVFLPSLLIAQELQQDYVNKGFYKAFVEGRQVKDTTLFIVTEGPRCVIKKIMVHGVDSYDAHWIEKRFFKKKGTFYFNEKKVHEALSDMVQWYKKEGFWDAHIVRHDYVMYKKQPHAFILKVVIEEGEQRFLSDIQVHGIAPELFNGLPFYQELVKERARLKKNIHFPIDVVARQKTFLLKKLRDCGYLKAKLSYTLHEESDGLVLLWDCVKGHKTTFGKTIMRGQTNIDYDYLIKLLSYKEGELWSKEKIQRSLITLRATGVFDRVNMFPSFKDLVDNQRDMILTVKDDEPFEVKLRMGFAQVSKNFYFKKGSTYTVGGSFIWKNPCARADRFSADLDFNRYEQKINVAYRLPLFGNIPLATTFKGYANKYIQPIVIGSSKPLYQVLQQGFLMGLSKSGSHYDCGVTSGFEWMEINNLSLEVARAINFETRLVDKKIPYFFIEPMIYSDFLDDKVNPTKGFFGMASLKGMFPFKESSYFVKMLAEYGTFISFFSSVIALHFRTGHIFRTDFKAIMPPERFFLGGPFSLRGYLQDYCPPLGSYESEHGQIQFVPQGGKTMLNANFELRSPLYKRTVWATIFQDFGILMEDPRDFFTRALPLAATGFGLRYLTPIGPLRFDIGWKWHKDRPEAKQYAWFLTLGNAF